MDEGLGIEKLRVDHWQHVSKFLRPNDLCRLMCVSRLFRSMWGSDRFWYHQELRVCSRFPELKSVFDKYSAVKPLAKKTRKETLHKIRKGIWYVFKTVLYKAGTKEGLRLFGKTTDMHPVVYAVVCLSIPNDTNVVKKEIQISRSCRNPMTIRIYTLQSELVFKIAPDMELLFLKQVNNITDNSLIYHWLWEAELTPWNMFHVWYDFLFEEPFFVHPIIQALKKI